MGLNIYGQFYVSMEGEVWERAMKGRRVLGALERVMRGRSESLEEQ